MKQKKSSFKNITIGGEAVTNNTLNWAKNYGMVVGVSAVIPCVFALIALVAVTRWAEWLTFFNVAGSEFVVRWWKPSSAMFQDARYFLEAFDESATARWSTAWFWLKAFGVGLVANFMYRKIFKLVHTVVDVVGEMMQRALWLQGVKDLMPGPVEYNEAMDLLQREEEEVFTELYWFIYRTFCSRNQQGKEK